MKRGTRPTSGRPAAGWLLGCQGSLSVRSGGCCSGAGGWVASEAPQAGLGFGAADQDQGLSLPV